MHTLYLVIAVLFALMVTYSGIGKIRRDPLQVKVVQETIGLPLKYFPLLAAILFTLVGQTIALCGLPPSGSVGRSEEHTSELQSLRHLVCRLLLEKKQKRTNHLISS